ncbi:MAG: M28 family peptidase [Chitinivibrionales bacterium]|nr:M28 family peptidase [Chitinivibrionales bacterium]
MSGIVRNLLKIFIILYITALSTEAFPPEYDSLVAKKVIKSLDIEKFKANDKALSDMGDRLYGSASNINAQQWLQKEFEGYGYKVTIHTSYKNIFVTKVGSISPDSGYIIGAHFDGRAGGGAADDNGSGTSLVLEGARVLADPRLKTHYSIRFVLFNSEETGLSGSTAYVKERSSLQGKEDPAQSNQFPEPWWLGMITHDMILFDHGVPPQQDQITDADIDVEYKSGSKAAQQSQALAEALASGAKYFGTYPAQVGSNMSNTDSDPFKDLVAAVSVRENQRISEIGNNSNPYYHKNTDLYSAFSEKDFLLGFGTVQMTIGTLCRLAGIFDSSKTGSVSPDDAGVHKKFMTVSTPSEVTIFDTRGRTVAIFRGAHDCLIFYKEPGKRNILPVGLYIMHLVYVKNMKEYRLLKIVN